MKHKIQVEKAHYFPSYDLGDRFNSYKEQIKILVNLNPSSILEIGSGNKFLTNYLLIHTYKIETLDIDKELNPTYVGDIRDMTNITKQFDAVCAFQVLEHLPFKDFKKALKNMKKKKQKTHFNFTTLFSCIFFN